MYDTIRIEGRGPVALALRLLLEREGLPPRVIDADPVESALPDWLGSRSLALALGSLHPLARIIPQCSPAALLEQPGIAAPITVVDITRAGASGGTRIEAQRLKLPMLGAVIRYATLHRLLREAIERAHLPMSNSADPPGSAPTGETLTVIADGDAGDSPSIRVREFGQMALLAEVEVERDRPGWAFERFTSEGPLALLPLPEPRRRALVWCAPDEHCRERAAADEHRFGELLHQTFGPLLGRLTLCSARHVSAVTRRIGPLTREPGRVAIGNAAQALHPVAGQGLNLGLRDAAVLARQLGDASCDARSLAQALAGFAQSRHADRELLVASTDLLASLTRPELLKPAHSAALALIDLCAPLRQQIARGLMFGLRSH